MVSVPHVDRDLDASGSVPTSRSRPDRLDLGPVYALFRRRIRLFFITVLAVFGMALLLALLLTPRYTATAEIVINARDDAIVPTSQKPLSDVPNSTADVETEIKILTSLELAGQVVDQLRLQDDPNLREQLLEGGTLTRVTRAVGLAPPVQTTGLTPEANARLRQAVISYVSANLDVQRLSSAFALAVSFTDSTPVRAAAIANAFAQLYTRGQLALKQQQNRDAEKVLSSRIGALQQQARNDFNALQQYRIANNLLSTTGATLTEQEISAYNQQVAAARAQAAADAAQLGTARRQLSLGSSGDDVGEALSSPVVQSLRGQRAQLGARFADYAGRYGPKTPELIDTLRQLTEVDNQIQAEINRTISNLEARSRVSRQRLESLAGSLNAARGALAQNNDAMVQQDDLQRRANTSQELYQSYLNRYKEVVAQGGAERADSRLVSTARVPGAPSFPKRSLFLALGAALGIGLGIAAAMIAELAYSGLTTGDEVEDRLDVPYLGTVPELKTVDPRAETPVDTVKSLARSPFAEAIRGLLVAVRRSGGRSQVILVTSALPGEGKTTIAACLAQSAAMAGASVIVVDCDAVRRQYSKDFVKTSKGQPGLKEVLAGTAPLAAAIVGTGEGTPRTLPITTPFAPNESFVHGDTMESLLARLREQFDLVILDSAPVLPIADTRELALLVDKVMLVGRWRRTPAKAMNSAMRLLPPAVQGNVGAVLTRVDMRQQARFGYGDATAFYGNYKSYYDAR